VLLDDGDVSVLQPLDLRCIGVTTGHPVPEMSQGGCSGKTHISHPDDGDRPDAAMGKDPGSRSVLDDERVGRPRVGRPRIGRNPTTP
jgi:hypothetical protein